LRLALHKLAKGGVLGHVPLNDHVAAVSCGIVNGAPILDLDYAEDSSAEADANFVFTGAGSIVEVQGTAERVAFSEEVFFKMLGLARQGIGQLVALQKKAIGG
jgi:ribonuclease PH